MDKNEFPFLSVIVPVFNAESTLKECLQSLIGQDYPNERYEIIVVNNMSTDRSVLIAQEFKNVKVLHQLDTQGISPTRNIGAKHASGDVLVFFDADQVANKNYLSVLLQSYPDKDYGAFASKNSAFDNGDSLLSDYWKIEWTVDSKNPAHLDKFSGGNFAMHKWVFNKIGGFDERMVTCEDFDLAWRMQKELNLMVKYELEAISYHYERTQVSGLFKREYKFGIGEVYLGRKFREARKNNIFIFAKLLKRTLLGCLAFFVKVFKLLFRRSSVREIQLLLLDIGLQWANFIGRLRGEFNCFITKEFPNI